MGTITILDTTATPETACQATAPALLVHITHFPVARGLPHSPTSSRIDDPQHVTAMEELEDRLAAEKAEDAAHASGEAYLSGCIVSCKGLGLYAATIPVGKIQAFLGYFPRLEMAQRSIRTFETAAGLGPPRRSHKKKPPDPAREEG